MEPEKITVRTGNCTIYPSINGATVRAEYVVGSAQDAISLKAAIEALVQPFQAYESFSSPAKRE